MSDAAENARIRSLRPDKPQVDPWRPLDTLVEEERGIDGNRFLSMTVFLAGSECPFVCNFCDLWRHTLDGPTPVGAIPRQLEMALDSLSPDQTPSAIKLYNASNFFDKRAVPEQDLATIAELLSGFRKVIVECHPRLVGESCLRFADLLAGDLEVAMGLETVHPVALPRLNKRVTLQDFEQATQQLLDHGLGVRAFVLLSPPHVPFEDCVEWTVRTVRFALDCGVGVISLIPVRPGNGELERLAAEGLFQQADLSMFETAMARSLSFEGGVILADLWDVANMASCEACRDWRIEHLQVMNRTGAAREISFCQRCQMPTGGKA